MRSCVGFRSLWAVACLGTGVPGVVWGCSEGSLASPPTPPPNQLAPCGDFDAGGFAVCPCAGVEATFSSIYSNVFATDSCGTDRPGACHSAGNTTGNQLFFAFEGGLDPARVYAEFVSAEGGVKAVNINSNQGSQPYYSILRVTPGDPDASLLYHKVTLQLEAGAGAVPPPDLDYGSGMPLNNRTNSASVCPQVVNAVEQWIKEGAPYN